MAWCKKVVEGLPLQSISLNPTWTRAQTLFTPSPFLALLHCGLPCSPAAFYQLHGLVKSNCRIKNSPLHFFTSSCLLGFSLQTFNKMPDQDYGHCHVDLNHQCIFKFELKRKMLHDWFASSSWALERDRRVGLKPIKINPIVWSNLIWTSRFHNGMDLSNRLVERCSILNKIHALATSYVLEIGRGLGIIFFFFWK